MSVGARRTGGVENDQFWDQVESVEAESPPPEDARAPMMRWVMGEAARAGATEVEEGAKCTRVLVTELVRTSASRGKMTVSRSARKGKVGDSRVGKRVKTRVRVRCVVRYMMYGVMEYNIGAGSWRRWWVRIVPPHACEV